MLARSGLTIPYFINAVAAKMNPLRFNIGFVIHEEAGYSKQFDFSFEDLHIPPDLTLQNLSGSVTFGRTPQGILAKVQARALADSECVRCLDNFLQPLQTEFSELYAFDSRSVAEEGLLVPDDDQIDLAPLLREFLLLDMPIKPLCKPDCPGLDPETGEKRSKDTATRQDAPIDPRFAALKKMLDETEE